MPPDTSLPPPLPHPALARVLRISGIDGWGLVVLAGGFGLLSALGGDGVGAIVGALAAIAGLIELRGRRRLQLVDGSGTRLLVTSQLLVLAVILIYVAYQYFAYDPLPMIRRVETELLSAQQRSGLDPVSFAETLGMSEADFANYIRRSVKVAYIAVGLASLLCQGVLAYYYHRKGRVLASSLRKT